MEKIAMFPVRNLSKLLVTEPEPEKECIRT